MSSTNQTGTAGSAGNGATNRETNQNLNARSNQNPNANAQNGRPANDRRDNRPRGGNRNQQSSFKPKIEMAESLSSPDEKKRQDFSTFQKSLNHHVMTTYKNSKNLSG